MEFCPHCENKLYMVNKQKEDSDKDKHDSLDEIVLFCKNCFFEKEFDRQTSNILYETQYKLDDQLYFHYLINEYTKFDPTLPLIMTPCPSCNHQEVVYLKYKKSELKYIYLCKECDHYWTDKKN